MSVILKQWMLNSKQRQWDNYSGSIEMKIDVWCLSNIQMNYERVHFVDYFIRFRFFFLKFCRNKMIKIENHSSWNGKYFCINKSHWLRFLSANQQKLKAKHFALCVQSKTNRQSVGFASSISSFNVPRNLQCIQLNVLSTCTRDANCVTNLR